MPASVHEVEPETRCEEADVVESNPSGLTDPVTHELIDLRGGFRQEPDDEGHQSDPNGPRHR